MVADGHYHVAAVTDRGGVWVWGSDFFSVLGPIPRADGGLHYRAIPVRWDSSVCGGLPVVMVACGGNQTLALTRAGHVWRCGYGFQGETDTEDVAEPVRVAGVERIAMVAAGSRSALAVAADGRLWSWGIRTQCPDENDEPVQVASLEVQNIPLVLELSSFGGSAVLFVTAGVTHAAVVTAAGELWTWGSGASGCTGLGELPAAQSRQRACVYKYRMRASSVNFDRLPQSITTINVCWLVC